MAKSAAERMAAMRRRRRAAGESQIWVTPAELAVITLMRDYRSEGKEVRIHVEPVD